MRRAVTGEICSHLQKEQGGSWEALLPSGTGRQNSLHRAPPRPLESAFDVLGLLLTVGRKQFQYQVHARHSTSIDTHQDIFGLEVVMHDGVSMEVSESVHHLPHQTRRIVHAVRSFLDQPVEELSSSGKL